MGGREIIAKFLQFLGFAQKVVHPVTLFHILATMEENASLWSILATRKLNESN